MTLFQFTVRTTGNVVFSDAIKSILSNRDRCYISKIADGELDFNRVYSLDVSQTLLIDHDAAL